MADDHPVFNVSDPKGLQNLTKFINDTRTKTTIGPFSVDFHGVSPLWATLVGAMNGLLFISVSLLDYAMGEVVWTLAVLEAPQTDLAKSRPTTQNHSKKDDDFPSTAQVAQVERTVTSSLRRTLRLLYRTGGIFAFWRGGAVAIATVAVCGSLGGLSMVPIMEGSFGENDLKMPDRPVLSVALACLASITINFFFITWSTAWVHILITAPTLRIWYRRLPPWWTTIKATWRVGLILELAQVVSNEIPALLRHALSLKKRQLLGGPTLSSHNIWLVLIFLLHQAFTVAAALPANIILTRIQASLLPEGEESIVPFDRTFGTGETAVSLHPGILAKPSGALSLRAAYQSLTRNDIMRLAILYVKLTAAEVVLRVCFWPVLRNDVWPDKWKPLLIH